mmetsp:Transcript_3475/g.5321  ORF Transcript_3475/g.5321 Transcript_3475/m.5321 type:complete len:143 (-) Transcript_3475:254-682(-)
MKYSLLLLALVKLIFILDKADATGYKPDPTHRYEHKQDIDKLLHPNHEIHVVQQRRSVPPKEHRSKTGAGPGSRRDEEDTEEDLLTGGAGNRNKARLMGVKNGYVIPKHSEINNVVTNILEASAAVERESVLKFDKKGRKGQ